MLIRRFYLLVEDSFNEVMIGLSKCDSSPTLNIKLFWFLEEFLLPNKIMVQD
jgi:hypothetical protein